MKAYFCPVRICETVGLQGYGADRLRRRRPGGTPGNQDHGAA